ncbi:VTT domain-containing protein [Clostridium tagluense]|uniref:VTT domain-containing protein n=1 Tax=Clostridium tagluense TaxID=360422 RepID=UPI001CF13D65|nr:VTT domain-containing protein [Clostridium tagluense]MCB2300067.1 VTT domain-containing protein [Clostridium tagluense]
MTKLFKIIIFLFWISIVFIFLKYQLYNDGVFKTTNFLNAYPKYSALLFLIIASLRIFTLVPCTVFIVIAAMLFSPLEAFILTTIANLLSESLLFLFTKLTFGMNYQNKIIDKYPKIYNMIKKNNVQILALGVSSPLVPSDAVCFFSVLSGISFNKYFLTVFIADTPVILLYTFLGISTDYSIYVFLATLVVIILVSYFNFKKWNNQID